MDRESSWLDERLRNQNLSRRQFLSFCGAMAATLALPKASTAAHIASTLEAQLAVGERRPVVWLEFQDCTGDTESFLRSNNPSVVDLIFDIVSLNYHETLMVAAGSHAEQALQETITRYRGNYLCIIEGAIPAGAGGTYCLIGGRTAQSIAQEVISGAAMTVAVGACAVDGGLPAALPNPTGAVGVAQAVPTVRNLVNLPGCPANGVNLMALLVHYMTYGTLPALDAQRRPNFAYATRIHQRCPRRENDEVGFYGDATHIAGGCLKELGCKGPVTYANCYQKSWNGGTNWPIGAGALCIGCTNAHFWDTMTPFFGGGEVDD